MPSAADFERELQHRREVAETTGAQTMTITAAELHRAVGGYPGPDHRMPSCCAAMRRAMNAGDRVLHEPSAGNGPSLEIEYRIVVAAPSELSRQPPLPEPINVVRVLDRPAHFERNAPMRTDPPPPLDPATTVLVISCSGNKCPDTTRVVNGNGIQSFLPVREWNALDRARRRNRPIAHMQGPGLMPAQNVSAE
jgi:hypothetical protein